MKEVRLIDFDSIEVYFKLCLGIVYIGRVNTVVYTVDYIYKDTCG